jgi:hypothetical protein
MTEDIEGNKFVGPRKYLDNYNREALSQSIKKGADEYGMEPEYSAPPTASKLISSVGKATKGTPAKKKKMQLLPRGQGPIQLLL